MTRQQVNSGERDHLEPGKISTLTQYQEISDYLQSAGLNNQSVFMMNTTFYAPHTKWAQTG